jgi:hypothetical protein
LECDALLVTLYLDAGYIAQLYGEIIGTIEFWLGTLADQEFVLVNVQCLHVIPDRPVIAGYDADLGILVKAPGFKNTAFSVTGKGVEIVPELLFIEVRKRIHAPETRAPCFWIQGIFEMGLIDGINTALRQENQ